MALSKITNESLSSGLDASKLTGTLPAAMGTDLAPVRSDILKLAIHSGIDGNRAAFNLDDSFIDTFEDDTGITTETTVDRDTTSEYVASIYTANTVLTPSSSSDWAGDTGSFSYGSGSTTTTTGDNRIYSNMSSALTGDFTVQFTATDETTHSWGVVADSEKTSTNSASSWYLGTTNTFGYHDQSTSPGHSYHSYSTTETTGNEIVVGSVVKITREGGTIKMWDDGVLVHTFVTRTYTGDMQFIIGNDGGGIGNLTSLAHSYLTHRQLQPHAHQQVV